MDLISDAGSIPAASTIIGQAQLPVSKGSCAFLFCTDSLSWHEYGIVSCGKDVRSYFFGCLGKTFFPCSSVDIECEFRRRVARELLGFFDTHPTLQHKINVGESAGVKIQLALRCFFGNACRLEVYI